MDEWSVVPSLSWSYQNTADPRRGNAERPHSGNTVPPPSMSSFNWKFYTFLYIEVIICFLCDMQAKTYIKHERCNPVPHPFPLFPQLFNHLLSRFVHRKSILQKINGFPYAFKRQKNNIFHRMGQVQSTRGVESYLEGLGRNVCRAVSIQLAYLLSTGSLPQIKQIT